MRTLLTLIFASVVLGMTGGASLGLNTQNVRDRVVGIAQDVGAILSSFAGGPDDPNGPLLNKATLAQARRTSTPPRAVPTSWQTN